MNVKISSVQIRVYINRCFDNLFHAFFFTINLTINLECSGRGMQSRFVLNLTNIYQHESCKQPHGSTAATITSTIRPITLLKIQLLLFTIASFSSPKRTHPPSQLSDSLHPIEFFYHKTWSVSPIVVSFQSAKIITLPSLRTTLSPIQYQIHTCLSHDEYRIWFHYDLKLIFSFRTLQLNISLNPLTL